MNQFEKAKENGLSIIQVMNLNTILGCVIASYLDNPRKTELRDFIQELEDYFGLEE